VRRCDELRSSRGVESTNEAFATQTKSPSLREAQGGLFCKQRKKGRASASVARMTYDITIDGKSYRIDLDRVEGGWSCRVDGREVEVDAVLARPDVLSLRIGNEAYEVKCERAGGEMHLWVGSARFAAEVRDPRSLRGRVREVDDQGPKKLTAPMPGKIVRLLVSPGDAVEAGAGVLVVEAMKMQNEIKSPKKGTIQKILVSKGAAVNAGDVLAIVE
jgi:acetyl/propionyl-CoA carboxylase alpha subunit